MAVITRERYAQLAGRVKLLSWLSLIWMTIGGRRRTGGRHRRRLDRTVGFGLDSAIEGFASVIIVWRFTGHRVFSHAAEQRAQRLVAMQFFLLAPYVAFESVKSLVGGEHPDVSWVGVGLAIGSVTFMPMLGIAKRRLADQLGSAATAGEGRQNMLCAYLAGALRRRGGAPARAAPRQFGTDVARGRSCSRERRVVRPRLARTWPTAPIRTRCARPWPIA